MAEFLNEQGAHLYLGNITTDIIGGKKGLFLRFLAVGI